MALARSARPSTFAPEPAEGPSRASPAKSPPSDPCHNGSTVVASVMTAEGWVRSSFAPTQSALVRTFNAIYEPDLLRRLPQVDREDIVKEYGNDPWLCNYFVNLWEYLRGEDTLTSYPYNVTIPIADVCNARCSFCTSWLEGTKVLGMEDVDKFAEVLAHARVLGIAGHGEPLSHPRCEELFAKIGAYLDPRCMAYLITNGVFLEKQRAALAKVNITTYNISLNAATPRTHDVVMGLGPTAFNDVMAGITNLILRRNTENPELEINISLVINRDNVHELADFIDMGNDLGVNKIYLRTLSGQNRLSPGLNYHRLPPYLHPRFGDYVEVAKAAIARSHSRIVTDVESWGAPVFSASLQELIAIRPPAEVGRKDALRDKGVREYWDGFYRNGAKGRGLGEPVTLLPNDPSFNPIADPMEDGSNPFNRSPRLHCAFVYNDFIINDFNLRLIPCCYIAQVPGFDTVRYDGSSPFFEYWNSPAFRTLRRSLREGPLYGACKKCPAQAAPPKPDISVVEELEGLRTKVSFHGLYDLSGDELHRGLQQITYSQTGDQEPVVTTEGGFLFRPIDPKDHLATPFLEVCESGRWLRVRCAWPQLATASERCVLTVQDECYNSLHVIGSYDSGQENGEFEDYVAVPERVKSIRLMMTATDMKPALIPYRLQIEQADADHLQKN